MSKKIAIVNQKGGVGKTTTSVNLAAALAHKGHKVLIIDMDPQGHSGEHLGIKAHKGSVLDCLTSDADLSTFVIPSYIKNLWVLPSNLTLGKFNQYEPGGRQFALRKALIEHEESYDYMIIDCQPSLSLLTLNALTACDWVMLPVQAEYLALDGLTQLIITLREIKTKLHPQLHIIGVLLTMFDRRNRLSFEVRHELEKNFEDDLFKTDIPRAVKLAEAPSFAQSIFEYAPTSPGADAYEHLAREVITKIQATANES